MAGTKPCQTKLSTSGSVIRLSVPAASNKHNSTRSATSLNNAKLVPAPSYVAPSGYALPGHTSVAGVGAGMAELVMARFIPYQRGRQTVRPRGRQPADALNALAHSSFTVCTAGPISRFQHHLHRAVLLLLEDLVGMRSLVERQHVAGERVDAQRIAVDEQRHDVVHPLLDVRLPHPQGDLLVEQGEHRERIGHPAVDTDQRDRSATAH